MAVIALDPGFRNTGWVIFKNGVPVKMGVITTDKTKNKLVRVADDNYQRCLHISNSLVEILDETKIRGMVGELPTGGSKSARAVKGMSFIVGIIAGVSAAKGIPIEWCSPNEVKEEAGEKKSTSKAEVMQEMADRYDFKKEGTNWHCVTPEEDYIFPSGKFEHIADALCVYEVLKKSGLMIKLID